MVQAVLPRFREAVGFGGALQLTSWFRDPVDNARVGGDRYSQHLLGWAFDVIGDEHEREHLRDRATAAGLTVVDYGPGQHTHVQFLPTGVLEMLVSGI